MEVGYHPFFERWLAELAEADEEVFGEVHPIVTARYDLHALRRTPPTQSTPYADAPPVLWIIYGYCRSDAGGDVAVALVGGDRASLGNHWYTPHIAEAQGHSTSTAVSIPN
jgi:hypothetical protein